MNKTNEELSDELHVCHERIAELERYNVELAEEPLICNTCEKEIDYMPWHYSTETDRHVHACNECWPSVNATIKAKWQAEALEHAIDHMGDDWDIDYLRSQAASLRKQTEGGDQ